ncbi:hypothetical protein KIPB_014359, partial [Kipferlia bialata]
DIELVLRIREDPILAQIRSTNED